MGTARQEILNKLKEAVHPQPEKPDFDAPVYHSIDKPLEQAFKENLELVNGSVYLCESELEIFEKLKVLLAEYSEEEIACKEPEIQMQLKKANIPFSQTKILPELLEVGITTCEFLVAHTGSAMVSSALNGGRQLFVYPPVHIIIARKNQLVNYLDAAYSNIQHKYGNNLPSQITLITGPSRTADIEKTLVMGAHGPRELQVYIY